MLRKITVTVMTLVLAGAPAVLALGPDPEGPARFGLCTALAANDGNGNSHEAPPFQALLEVIEGDTETSDATPESTPESTPEAHPCDDARPGNGQGNGQGAGNGQGNGNGPPSEHPGQGNGRGNGGNG